MIHLGVPFDCDTHWKYFCVWHFLTVFLLPCNHFIVILSGSHFVFAIPWKYFCLQQSTAILLIVVFPGNNRLDSPFIFGISWYFC